MAWGSAAVPGPVTAATASVGAAVSAQRAHRRDGRAHWGMLAAFAVAFTVVYAFLSVWVFQLVSDVTQERLMYELKASSLGGAAELDARALALLQANVPAVPDPATMTGLGYPDSPAYWEVADELLTIYNLVPEANPYTYFRDRADGKLYFGVSAGATLSPPLGVQYRVPVEGWVPPEAYALMERGLVEQTMQDAYTDVYGTWVSSYTPVRDADGAVVAGLGVDYPLAYVDRVQAEVRGRLLPVLGISYVVMLALVLGLATLLVRPLGRLADALRALAAGRYDARPLTLPRFPHEMRGLGEAFEETKAQVADREAGWAEQVRRLKAELARVRRTAAALHDPALHDPAPGPARDSGGAP